MSFRAAAPPAARAPFFMNEYTGVSAARRTDPGKGSPRSITRPNWLVLLLGWT